MLPRTLREAISTGLHDPRRAAPSRTPPAVVAGDAGGEESERFVVVASDVVLDDGSGVVGEEDGELIASLEDKDGEMFAIGQLGALAGDGELGEDWMSAVDGAVVCMRISAIAELPVQVRRIVITALLTGMRQEEVVRLEWSAVDLEARQITLVKTKSNKVRPVYLNDAAVVVLKEAMAVSSKKAHVFGDRSGEPYTTDGVRSIFRRARDRAGIKNFRFHDLRHTTATRLRRAGAGLDVIADVLGHSTLAMARRYTHLGKETIRAAMDALPPPRTPSD